ncbi:unnamed protein product [Moneuplotes crassus]|uniref:ADP-ribosylation factor n=1 Tax=Euplotes crassus TaxID=5936 RepID=A0AAD1Y0B3_EUPCR|nr:unnamed protein product [Moneuplotes crassus]
MGCNISLSKGSDSDTAKIVLLLGLDNSGKTTLLYRIKNDEFSDSVPTIGLNIEEVEKENFRMTLWDVSGKSKKLWKHYYDRVDGIIFVVDSTDTDRISEVKRELESIILEETLQTVPIMILCNKTDISNGLKCLKTENDNFDIAPCSAKTGIGVWEGIEKLQKLFPS